MQLLVPSTYPLNVMIYNLNHWSIEVKWQPPAIPNGIITEYAIKYGTKIVDQSGNKTITVSNHNQSNSAVVSNLMNGTAYWLTIAAKTSVGRGPFAPTIDFVVRDGGIFTQFYNQYLFQMNCIYFMLPVHLFHNVVI